MLLTAPQYCCCDMPWWFVGTKDEEPNRRPIVGFITMTRQNLVEALRLPIRAALAAGFGVAISQLLGFPFPIYAMIAAVIVTDIEPSQTRQLVLPRLVGTLVGASLGAAIHPLLQPGPWGCGVAILGAMFITNLLRLPAAAKVAGYVCGIVVLSHVDHPWFYALYRTAETILGIAVAVLVSLVPRLIPIEEAKQPAQLSDEERSTK